MRRLTLILSDLYLPEEAPREAASAALDLPKLAGLLRFARASRIDSWRAWLAREVGAGIIAPGPVAQLAAVSVPTILAPSTAWFATPVTFEARLDHVRMLERGLLRMTSAERAEWCAEFTRAFGPEYLLHDAGERGFLITGIAETEAAGVDPARVLGADIGHALPAGARAGELRRLMAEIEMWLHAAPLNAVRERERRQRISALWLWGGGPRAWTPGVPTGWQPPPSSIRLSGGDPWLTALAWLGRLSPSRSLSGFADLDAATSHDVVELAPMSGPAPESLPALEQNWFGPARAALASGALGQLDLVANDRWFRLTSRSAWRFWRRLRPWLEVLGREALRAQA
jgi:hypothetical protein